jgi:hypothetical protein
VPLGAGAIGSADFVIVSVIRSVLVRDKNRARAQTIAGRTRQGRMWGRYCQEKDQ